MVLDLPVQEAQSLATPAAPARTLAEALQQYGQPTLRQPLPDGRERLRWIKVHDSLLASMDVTTIEVSAAGRIEKLDRRAVKTRDPAAY
jgi:hypothetical protein